MARQHGRPVVTVALLALALPAVALLVGAPGLSVAFAQGSGEAPVPEPRPDTLATYLADLEAALGVTSSAALLRARDVEDARLELLRARRGLSAMGEFLPGAEYESNLARGVAAWDVDVELELSATYSYDRANVIEAEIDLAEEQARLRAQLRGDLERLLLALSVTRLAERAVAEARLELAEANAELAAAEQAGLPELEIELLRVEAELEAVALEQELLDQAEAEANRNALAAGAGSSTRGTSAGESGVDLRALATPTAAHVVSLLAPPAPQLSETGTLAPRTAPGIALLALELALAEQELSLAPFEAVRELEVYGAYEIAGVEAGGRLALEVGVPTAAASLGWQSGEDDHAFTVGLGATFRLSDSSSAGTTVAQRDVAEARAALASHVSDWPAQERRGRALAELAYREFELELVGAELNAAAYEQLAAAGADERDLERARADVRRAQDAGERAWQRYVRALSDYLDVIDVVLRFD